jgi:predicted transcriptional regulator
MCLLRTSKSCCGLPEYKQREYELCEKIRELSQEMDRLSREKKDITHISRCLEAILDEFTLFRRDCTGQKRW